MDIQFLGHVTQEVGAKAANLSLLAEKFPVPPGFVIPASGPFDPLNADDITTILDAYRLLGSGPVAVRSSGLDEDGGGASFAGQHLTVLNVNSEVALIEAVDACRASAGTKQALAYRAAAGLPADDIKIAVLVQKMVDATSSFVAFSANPATGNRDEVLIDATWGLGESLVSGHVIPDAWTFNPCTGLTMFDSGRKQWMTQRTATGTEEVPVPEEKQRQAAISLSNATAVVELVRNLEHMMGYPVDIEGAFNGDKLYLLQCRPITSPKVLANA